MQHTVSKPRAPFPIRGSRVEVHQIPVWQDNLVWLLVDHQEKIAAAVDGPEAEPVLNYCQSIGVKLTTIFNTHTHFDHVGINNALQESGGLAQMRVVGAESTQESIPGITEKVKEGSKVSFGDLEGLAMLTEGHIDGHISYLFGDVLFCGDTMFGAGCGYLFDGPPEKMYQSLLRLSELPEETKLCCAHEYTLDNLRFAWSLEPNNPALAERIKEDRAILAEGGCTIPSTIGRERKTNPFLRQNSAELLEKLKEAMSEAKLESPADIFAASRALKDRKDYRQISDEQLT